MKGKFIWIIGILETIIGFVLFVSAQVEISVNSAYSWRQPYTTYEAKIVMMKWIGIALLFSGIIWIGLKLYQKRYTSKHIQEVNQVIKRGGANKCPNCGLSLSADVKNCPRCGNAVKSNTSDFSATVKESVHFCSNCGNQVSTSESFCPKCGQKISK